MNNILIPSFTLQTRDETGCTIPEAKNKKGICGRDGCENKIDETRGKITFSEIVCHECKNRFEIMRAEMTKRIKEEVIEELHKRISF